MNVAAFLVLIVILVGMVAVANCLDQRLIRRSHAADPRNERWLCENLECGKHLRHRGACNDDERSQIAPAERCAVHPDAPSKYCWDCETLGPAIKEER